MVRGIGIGLGMLALLAVPAALRWSAHDHDRQAQALEDLAVEPVEQAVLHRIALPGMSIEAFGTPKLDGNYREGEAHLGAESYVTWHVGAMPGAAERDELAGAVMAKAELVVHESKDLAIGGAPAHEVTLANTTGGVAMTLAFATCGGRALQFVIGGADVRANEQRLASFRCTPDPTQDLERFDVVVDARPGWSRLPNDADTLALIDANDVRVAPYELPVDEPGTVEQAIVKEMKVNGYELHAPAKPRGDKLFWTGNNVATGAPIAMLAWRCDKRIAFVLVASPSRGALDGGIALAETGRCLHDSEPMPKYATVAH